MAARSGPLVPAPPPTWVYPLLLVLLLVFALAPLAYPGFFEAQSGFLPAFNAEHLSQAPHWGRLAEPVRGEGKLPYLLVWPFFLLSGSGVAAVKWGYGLAFLLGALGVYAWTRRRLDVRGAMLAAVVYTYLPWHLGTVYVRGAYAEAWLWAFWPWLLWAIDHLADLRPRSLLKAIVVGLPLLAATLWTQPGLALLCLPLLLAYGVVVAARSGGWCLRLAEALALAALALWAVARQVPENPLPLREGFLLPFQLLSAAWGDGTSYQLGLAAVGLALVAVALWLAGRAGGLGAVPGREGEAGPSLGPALGFWAVALLVVVLCTLPLSAPVWRLTGFDRFVHHPWQLLALAGLPLAFLAGAPPRLDARLATLPAWAGLVALVVLASYPYLAPRFTQVDPGPEPVALFQPLDAAAPQILLLEYEIEAPGEITPTLAVTLTWQAVEPVAGDYTVFVHVLAGETKVAQRDTRPCSGECPTDTWSPGAIVIDRYELSLPPEAPPGPYRLAVGLYLLETGDRAAVAGRDDATVILDVR